MTLSNLQSLSLAAGFSNVVFFVQLCSSWQDLNWHFALRDPYEIAEFLVRTSSQRLWTMGQLVTPLRCELSRPMSIPI